MTPEDFKAWMATQNLAKPGAARALGVSEGTIADWMRGTSRTTGKPVAPDVNADVNVNAGIHKM